MKIIADKKALEKTTVVYIILALLAILVLTWVIMTILKGLK